MLFPCYLAKIRQNQAKVVWSWFFNKIWSIKEHLGKKIWVSIKTPKNVDMAPNNHHMAYGSISTSLNGVIDVFVHIQKKTLVPCPWHWKYTWLLWYYVLEIVPQANIFTKFSTWNREFWYCFHDIRNVFYWFSNFLSILLIFYWFSSTCCQNTGLNEYSQLRLITNYPSLCVVLSTKKSNVTLRCNYWSLKSPVL